MTQLNQVYRCNICGNIVEAVHGGVGQLVCCGQATELLEEKIADIGQEKHLPVVEKNSGGIKIKIGSLPHPMEEKHYIEWAEVIIDNNLSRKLLKPGNKPEVEFLGITGQIKVKIYCNIHGLWKTEFFVE